MTNWKAGAAAIAIDASDGPTAEDSRSALPQQGDWFWVTGEDRDENTKRWLACVTHLGSNYVELTGIGGGSNRIHFDRFWTVCEREPNPDAFIDAKVEEHQTRTRQLMAEVVEVMRRLAITPTAALAPNASEPTANALVTVSQTPDVGEYKSALEKAQKEDLPELFQKIEKSNKATSRWMKAKAIPLEALAAQSKGVVGLVNERILNVELYAGLLEDVVQVTDGAPAGMSEPVHLMQRRGYMDEECLYEYSTGGMDFKKIEKFDAWLARPKNLNRILPHPRTVMAFCVRRKEKERDWAGDLRRFIEIYFEERADKMTFLYVRNGDQLFRITTEIDFGEKLFPDLDHHILKGGHLYAEMFCGRVDDLISDGEYEARIVKYDRRKAEHEAEVVVYEKMTKAERKEKGVRDPWLFTDKDPRDDYEAFDPSTVHYDDIAKHVQAELTAHNRIVVVLQGLLDRSPVLHPHPPWSLWTEDGFRSALRLVYDGDRALVPGEKPDFEAYRARLNATLRTGSITVGQEVAWEKHEAKKEGKRRDNDWRDRSTYRPARFRPNGDPGPGVVARVERWSRRCQTAMFTWKRPRAREVWRSDAEPKITRTFTTSAANLLNVSAYQKGDYRQFFADPRTRAEYVQWAPLLLEAEEYLAGNREIGEEKK